MLKKFLKKLFNAIIESRQHTANQYIARFNAMYTEPVQSKVINKDDLRLIEHRHKDKNKEQKILWFWTNTNDKVLSPLFKSESEAVLWK